MTIKLDIAAKAAFFGQDSKLLQAVDNAEGDLVKAVKTKDPVTRDKAVEVLARSATHAMRDFIRAKGLDGEFVEFWGARWAPRKVANDPHDLNANWVPNVKKLWLTS